MRSMISALIFAVTLKVFSQSSSDSTDPCTYCVGDPCNAPSIFSWVCCNDGTYQTCGDTGTIEKQVCAASESGCVAGTVECDPAGCNPDTLECVPFNQGGAGSGFGPNDPDNACSG